MLTWHPFHLSQEGLTVEYFTHSRLLWLRNRSGEKGSEVGMIGSVNFQIMRHFRSSPREFLVFLGISPFFVNWFDLIGRESVPCPELGCQCV